MCIKAMAQSSILGHESAIFTFSIHGERNFPFRKIEGDLDIGLANGTMDTEYLDTLEVALEHILYMHQPRIGYLSIGCRPLHWR